MGLFKRKKDVNESDISLRRELIDRIELIWKDTFEFRFGQFLWNALGAYKPGNYELQNRFQHLSDVEWMNVLYRYAPDKHDISSPIIADYHEPARIPTIIKHILQYWNAHPDMTFSEVTYNHMQAKQPGGSIYGASDSIWYDLK